MTRCVNHDSGATAGHSTPVWHCCHLKVLPLLFQTSSGKPKRQSWQWCQLKGVLCLQDLINLTNTALHLCGEISSVTSLSVSLILHLLCLNNPGLFSVSAELWLFKVQDDWIRTPRPQQVYVSHCLLSMTLMSGTHRPVWSIVEAVISEGFFFLCFSVNDLWTADTERSFCKCEKAFVLIRLGPDTVHLNT